jgi:regulator of protease activity HflC (stomatin/prohibitin superfamily)
MFDKLISFILEQIYYAVPVYFVLQFQKGCRYRAGKFVEELNPGFHWKIPWIDRILVESCVDTTLLLPIQSVKSINDEPVVVRGVVGYKIDSMAKFYNNVYDTKSALSDNACYIIRQQCASWDMSQIADIKKSINLKKLLQKHVENYGLVINFFGFIEISEASTFRLYTENVKLES